MSFAVTVSRKEGILGWVEIFFSDIDYIYELDFNDLTFEVEDVLINVIRNKTIMLDSLDFSIKDTTEISINSVEYSIIIETIK